MLLASNQQINWVPDHIKEGRFENGLKVPETGQYQEIEFGEHLFQFG